MPGNEDKTRRRGPAHRSAAAHASPHDQTSTPALRAQAASLARENRALKGEVAALRRFIESMRQLARAAETKVVDTEVITLLDEVLGHAMSAVGARDGSLLALDEDTGELVFVVARGEASMGLLWRRLPPGEGIAGWVAENRRATIVNEATLDERFYRRLDRELQFKTRSVLAAPLIGGGQVLGVVELLNKQRDEMLTDELFNKSDETLLLLLCLFAGELLDSVVDRAAAAQVAEPRPSDGAATST
ncbi:MAG: GAF domain-containing protein [Gammaproteobacteria bacterium]